MKLLSELDSLDNVKDGSIRKLPTKTSDLTNDSGFITSSISVIDNLTSTSTTSALSANQGKVLNDNKATKLSIGQWKVPYRDLSGDGEPNTSRLATMTSPLPQAILIRDAEGKATFVGGTSANQGIVKSQLDSAVANMVTTNTTQTIAGTKTFSDDLTLSKKLYVGAQQTIYNADAEDGFTGSLFFGNGGAALSHTTGDTGYYNTGIGKDTLVNNTTGSYNTAVGYKALYSNIMGGDNIAVGHKALYYNTGNNSIAIGDMSFYSKTTGISNIAIGFYAGNYISDGTTPNTIINDSIFIGGMSRSLADNQTNQIVIGHSATGHGSNTVTIGDWQITDNYFKGNLHLTGALKNATNTFTLPTATGTLALTSDIPSSASFATLSGTQILSNKTLASPNITTQLNFNGNALGASGGLDYIVSTSNSTTSTYIKYASGLIFQSGVIDHGSDAYDWTANITFTGFTNKPRIFACPLESSGGGCMAYVYRTPTNTGATIRQTSKYGASGKARYVYWFAIGK